MFLLPIAQIRTLHGLRSLCIASIISVVVALAATLGVLLSMPAAADRIPTTLWPAQTTDASGVMQRYVSIASW